MLDHNFTPSVIVLPVPEETLKDVRISLLHQAARDRSNLSQCLGEDEMQGGGACPVERTGGKAEMADALRHDIEAKWRGVTEIVIRPRGAFSGTLRF